MCPLRSNSVGTRAARLLRSPITWMLPFGLAIVVLSTVGAGLQTGQRGYFYGVVVNSLTTLIAVAALASFTASIYGSRLRSSAWLLRGAAMAPWRLVLRSLVAPFSLGLGLWMCGLVVELIAYAPYSYFAVPWLALLAVLCIIALHSFFGFTIGCLLPAALAAPLALASSFCWMGFTGATEPFALRYLAGFALGSCCEVTSVLAPQAVFALLAASLGIGCLVCCVLWMWWPALRGRLRRGVRPVIACAGVLALLAGLSGGLWFARDLGPYPNPPRPAAELVCSGTAPEICVFPEQAEYRTERSEKLIAVAHAAYVSLGNAGISVPARITTSWGREARPADPTKYEESAVADGLILKSGFAPADVHAGIASMYANVPIKRLLALQEKTETRASAEGCEPGADAVSEASLRAEGVKIWLMQIMGSEVELPQPGEIVGGDIPAEEKIIAETVEQLRALPRADRHSWLADYMRRGAGCNAGQAATALGTGQ